MDLSRYKRVVLTTKSFDGLLRVDTRIKYEAELIIVYHKGEFSIEKDRYNNRKRELDENTKAKFLLLLQSKKTEYLKWEKLSNRKNELFKFGKRLNEVL